MQEMLPSERLIQRSRLYLGRTSRTALGRGPRASCIYLHIPKCGGTSLSEALYATVPLNRKIGILDAPSIRRALAMRHLGLDDVVSFHDEGDRAEDSAAFREMLVLMYVAQGCRLIHGHFLLSSRIWEMSRSRYEYVSLLRDPIERTISNYRMAHRNGIFRGDFDAFLDSVMGRRMSQHVLRFFSGRATIPPGEEAAAMRTAHGHMAGFALIGFLDDLGGFARAYGDLFGVRPRIAHYNRASGPELTLSKGQMARLEALCAHDIELTDAARRRA